MSAFRYRLRFAKSGDLIWVAHRDLLRAFERAARVADLPLVWSQGYNPRPDIHVALALAVGIAARAEVVEIGLAEPLEPPALRARWQAALPSGCALGATRALPDRAPAARATGAEYRADWQAVVPALAARADALLRAPRAEVARRLEHGTRPVDVRHWLEGCRAEGDRALVMALRVEDGTARPQEVLQAMGLPDPLVAEAAIERTALRLADEASGGPTGEAEA
jgi:radical SAM-linked protein